MTFEAYTINAQHKDLIHDVAYNYYGDRLATCSSDQFVKVWDQDEHGNWNLSAAWKAHSGSVWKVTWAHPEYGQVIATCSFDRTASIWEEIIDTNILKESGGRQWVRRANLVDSRTSVTDVKFTPKTIGLFLTTCASDGILRIYEAPDIMNLSLWTHQHEVSSKLSCSCLTWTSSFNRYIQFLLSFKQWYLFKKLIKYIIYRLHVPLVAIGSDDNNPSAGPKVLIYEYSEVFRKFSKVADTVPYCFDAVHDITFATTHGRSYHLLAIATKNVRIIKVKPIQENVVNLQGGTNKFEITTLATFEDHYCTVWRVSWNVLGTVLASSGDDGCVRLWKC
ncbi:hypothetical protein PGB90_007165 [Kerria lacca]